MRRFWKEVTLEPTPEGQAVRLDGRPVKTPTGNALALPTQEMADAVVAEWEAVEKTLNPIMMPVTGFANAAIDRIAPDRAGFAAAIAAYGETDLFCYRGAAGEALSERQAQVWDPWLDWAKARYDIDFVIVDGIMHQPQPPQRSKYCAGQSLHAARLNWRQWRSLRICRGRSLQPWRLSNALARPKISGTRPAWMSFGRKNIGAPTIGRKKTATTARANLWRRRAFSTC